VRDPELREARRQPAATPRRRPSQGPESYARPGGVGGAPSARNQSAPWSGEDDVSFIVSRWNRPSPSCALQEAESNRLLRMEDELHEVGGWARKTRPSSRSLARPNPPLARPASRIPSPAHRLVHLLRPPPASARPSWAPPRWRSFLLRRRDGPHPRGHVGSTLGRNSRVSRLIGAPPRVRSATKNSGTLTKAVRRKAVLGGPPRRNREGGAPPDVFKHPPPGAGRGTPGPTTTAG